MLAKNPLLIWFSSAPLCEGLTEEEVAGLFDLFEVVTIPRGAALYREGEAADALFVVLEGRVEVARGGRVLGEVGPGSTVGEMSLFLQAPLRSATVVAATEVTVLRIDRERFHAQLVARAVPAVVVSNLAQQLAERLASANAHLSEKKAA